MDDDWERTEELKETVVCLFFPFILPRTQRIDFKLCIRAEPRSEAKRHLIEFTSRRDEMCEALYATNMSALINTLNAHLEGMYGLASSLQSQPYLHLNEPISICWTSALRKTAHKTGSRKMHMCFDFRFEVIMILTTLGLAYYNRAAEIMRGAESNSFDENVKRAAAYLRKAAGIFDHLATVEIPKWQNPPPERAIETSPEVAKALSNLCIATAQLLAIKKGLQGGGTSAGLLAKLTLEAGRVLGQASLQLRSRSGGTGKISPPFLDFVDTQLALTKAAAANFLALTHDEQEKHGLAVSYGKLAVKNLQTIKEFREPHLLAGLAGEIRASSDKIRQFCRRYQLHNNHIHYQKEVDEKLLNFPEGKSLVKPEPFVPPTPSFPLH
jgi:hypothetical protein